MTDDPEIPATQTQAHTAAEARKKLIGRIILIVFGLLLLVQVIPMLLPHNPR